MSTLHQWPLVGLDISTAFLQTMPTEADRDIFTTGVQELRDALGIGSEDIMKVLRNIYGSTTAPRGLWLDLHRRLSDLGAQAVPGERCLWEWTSNQELDQSRPRVIGAMGGHVDDFHRTGDPQSGEWTVICEKVNAAYQWGSVKQGTYRHAGTDVATVPDEHGHFKIVVDQQCYIETLMDVEIEPERLRSNEPLSKRDVEACRTTLGALQWLAIQSQPQLCARCNILLTELVTNYAMETAREIQMMVGEIRAESYKLQFRKPPDVKHWSKVVFISMGDQAHNNRPRGDSTGGMVTLIAGPSSLSGRVSPMCIIAWKTWKLRRKSISSNDAEVQAILDSEDVNFRARLLWTKMHGAGGPSSQRPLRQDMVEHLEQQAIQVRGVLCTDSRGGYDALEVNESPLLGLSNMRAALQAFQLRDNLKRSGCELRWLVSDFDLGDALTKKKAEARAGLIKFMQKGVWAIRFDPTFTSARKSKQQGRSAIGTIDREAPGAELHALLTDHEWSLLHE